MTVVLAEETITYDPALRHDWVSGKLPKEWRRAYPDLFDEDDLRLALSQPSYHFYEWLGALHYYEKGFGVLVEQYVYKSHPRKLAVVSKIMNKEELDFLRKLPVQPPDLFIYRGADRHFFFAEVKSARNELADSQRAAFVQVVQRLATEVWILRVIANDSVILSQHTL